MVIGNGMIANKFVEFEDDNTIFFASGVSNSNETNLEVFKREDILLKKSLKENGTKTFIYFSSCDVDNHNLNSKAYYQHKLRMENVVASHKGNYYIFRLPQVAGLGGNKNTLINFLIDKIKNEKSFDVWLDTKKNIIDIDDVYNIISYILKNKKSFNSACNIINTQYISVLDLVKIIETKLNKKASYKLKKLNTSYYYNSSCIKSILKNLNIEFNNNYFTKLISKYSS